MHVYLNDQLLKTKIVATFGAERGGLRNDESDYLLDPEGSLITDRLDSGTLLRWFIHEGVDIIRLNMSFASVQQPYGATEAKVLNWLNDNKAGLAKDVAVLGDLPGPKIRVKLDRPQNLKRGDKFSLDFSGKERTDKRQDQALVLVNERPFQEEARIVGFRSIGDYIRKANRDVIFYVGDGNIVLKAEEEREGIVTCTVLKPDKITDKKGLTIKHVNIDIEPFQSNDKAALDFLLEHGGDVMAFIAVSFVRKRSDVEKVKKYVDDYFIKQHSLASARQSRRFAPAIIAKIETVEAWENIDDILDVADGIMVARGDLGLQLDPQQVPAIQKQLIRKCNLRGKPVITATQMLDSMEENWEPTRAEAADVFNAILDGTDAVMLSGETSKGKCPVQAIRMMVEIAKQAEKYYFEYNHKGRFLSVFEGSVACNSHNTERLARAMEDATTNAENPILLPDKKSEYEWQRDLFAEKLAKSKKQATTDRISQAAAVLSDGGEYKAIIAPTTSGRTARMISRFRPNVPILGVAHDEINARKLLLSFGIYPLCIGGGQKSVEDILSAATNAAMQVDYISWLPNFRLLRKEDSVISTSGTPLFVPGTTNLIQIIKV